MKVFLLLLACATVWPQTKTELLIAGSSRFALPKADIALIASPGRPVGSFFANVNTDAKKSWRMVYDEAKIYALFESTGYTYTINTLFIAATKEECIARAKKVGLAVPADPIEREPVSVKFGGTANAAIKAAQEAAVQ